MQAEIQPPYNKVGSIDLLSNASPLICNTYMRMNQVVLLRAYANSISEAERDLLIVHPHTPQLLEAAVVYAGLSNIFESEIDSRAYFRQFRRNEIVIYKNSRYQFIEVSGSYCILKRDDNTQSRNNREMIPLDRALSIRPYSGSATSTGSQGLRKNTFAGSDYLKRLVGVEYERQVDALSLSTIVVCARDRAEQMATRLFFYDGGVFHRLSDVLPCAWQSTSDDSVFFSGTVGKGYPSIIFTNRISLARELLFDDRDDRIFSVIVDDINLRRISLPELEDVRELLCRRKKHRFVMLMSVGKMMTLPEAFDISTLDVVYWSQELLLTMIDDLYHDRAQGNDQEIMAAIDCSIDYQHEKRSIDAPDKMAGIQECKDKLRSCVRQKERSTQLDEFIICAYGLINLFEQICVPLGFYEDLIENGQLSTRSPRLQLSRLHALESELSQEFIAPDVSGIQGELALAYHSLQAENPKATEIKSILSEKRRAGQKVRLLTTKASYAYAAEKAFAEYSDVLSVTTLSDASGAEVVDCAIISATPNLRKDGFNPCYIERAQETIVLQYPSEQKKNRNYERLSDQVLSRVRKVAKTGAKRYFSEEIDEPIESAVEPQEDESDADLEEQLSIIETNFAIQRIAHTEPGIAVMRAHRLARFSSGEWALLSRYYAPYLLDESKGIFVTKNVEELKQGDIMVFSAKSEAVLDFVEQMLVKLVERNAALRSHYERSKRWKTILREYMARTGKSYGDISKLMGDLGHPRHHVTIASWLNEDSNIIGPRDDDAFLAIGLVTGDTDIGDHADEYKQACDIVRRQRTKILGYVQSGIIRSVLPDSGQASDEVISEEEKALLGDVGAYARRLVIERVDPYERDVPSHLVNRPLER